MASSSWLLTFLTAPLLIAAGPAGPRVALIYQPMGTVFDRGCEEMMKVKIDSDLIAETAGRMAEFQRWWDTEGPIYMKAALSEAG